MAESSLIYVGFTSFREHFWHRWQYTEAMPLIPILHIGLTPVLQLLLIPLAVLLLTSRSSNHES